MKTIENKTVTLSRQGVVPITATYFEWIKAAIEFKPQGSMKIDDVRFGVKIYDIIDANPNTIQIEDADFEKVKKGVNDMNWTVIDKTIVEFVDYINGL